ncbi:thiamine pyrophosphate-binding protein [Paraferrimonas sedimenticola]|uniref:Acetolactate synthase n=1 Tax=Paraferrimonas sedimenticola TaxID=375674 RepID=A0AA37RZ01_9GAMM|nr:thiamine pyrophosphate-binding protein [Paraferrimonas sedimenticola]GLP97786.1 acetolactate synthase [Paraferrimonas sedimenticola]
MRKTGAALVRHALEQIGVRHTFGIPGVHNTEIYDELNRSESISPHLVTHEEGASFAADAISRTTDSIGTVLLVPAAGLTHAASGIAEAHLDGVPMLIITGGVRTDTGNHYQLHDMDQHAMMAPITKACFKPTEYQDIIPSIYQAYDIAVGGEPGPVYVEIPVNLQLLAGEVDAMPDYQPPAVTPIEIDAQISAAVELLKNAKNPGIFVGWGAQGAGEWVAKIAEHVGAPISTTLQGLSALDSRHPLHTGMSFGRSSVPAAENAFAECDCMLAIATRFSEIPTGSFGVEVTENLIHLDINPEVFSKNYPAKVKLEGDAKQILPRLYDALASAMPQPVDSSAIKAKIAADKAAYVEEWKAHDSGERVNPIHFYQALRKGIDDDALVVCDDGNHTFLTAELMPIHCEGGFISPTDFNAMGYCIPAVTGAKLANPERTVLGIVGDGAAAMTGMEALTASHNQLGVVYYVFNDGELSQISQAQQVPYNRKTCTVLPSVNWQGLAMATNCEYLLLDSNQNCDAIIAQANELAAKNRPVFVDVRIDYSKATRFTSGAVKTNFKRFDLRTKVRFMSRALWRRLSNSEQD